MAVIEWNTNWHSGPTMNGTGHVDIWRNSERDATVYFSGWASNDRVYSDCRYPFSVQAYIEVDGIQLQWINVTEGSYSGTGYFSGSFSWGSGSGTVRVHYYCGQPGGCTRGCQDIVVGSCNVPAYNPDVPPTNVTGGAIYNQNGVQNGNEKPDRQFYGDWWRRLCRHSFYYKA